MYAEVDLVRGYPATHMQCFTLLESTESSSTAEMEIERDRERERGKAKQK